MRKFMLSVLVSLAALFLFSAAANGEILISEVMASNGVYKDGEAYDWLELHNTGDKAVDLSGCYLSNSRKNPLKWAFPEGARIKAGGYLLVYCTGEELAPGKGPYYANFKISASGTSLLLTARDGETALTALAVPPQYGAVSWGLPSGGGDYAFFENATPGEKNEKTGCPARTAAPSLLTPGGFYSAAVTVQAQPPSGAALRYTLDGSTPTEKSKLWPENGLTLQKTAVLRLRAFGEGLVSSPVASASFLIGQERPVPVVSLITDERYLFNQKTGALVKGTKPDYPNYEREWEYPVNIEYFNLAGECEINQMGTFTAAGHSARQNAQKSIALYARKAYGPDRFYFNPFPNRDYASYKSLLLRGANSDAFSTRLRDAVISSLARPLDIIYQDALAIEVYINGEYWGHYNLREKINKHFIAQWEGVTDEKQIDQIDLLARTGSDQFVQNGSNEDWLALCDFCKTKDLNDPENLRYVEERLDIQSLFTHAVFEIIIGNNDFTNVRMYRAPGGKWKYLLFDVEAGFLSLGKGPMEYYIKPLKAKIQGFRHEPLAALLAVPEKKAEFLTRFAQVLELSFQWPQVEAAFAPWEQTLETLLPRHLARWKHFTLQQWRQNVNAVKYYARVRPLKILDLLQKHMKLTDAEMAQYFGSVRQLLEETNKN